MLSLIAPARDEEPNIGPLVEQAHAALAQLGEPYEFIIVDDTSADHTREVATSLMPGRPWLRVIAMPAAGRLRPGQSRALAAGIRASHGDLVAMIDADLQNDPADLAPMLDVMRAQGADLVQGDRTQSRQDSAVRKAGARIGRISRRLVLGDTIRDSGCSLRIMTRPLAMALPLEREGMHRFIPFIASSLGYSVIETPVSHRPRAAGATKYGLGIRRRAVAGDLLMVRRMYASRRPIKCEEVRD